MDSFNKDKLTAALIGLIVSIIPVWTAWQLGAILSGKIILTPLFNLWIILLVIISVPAIFFLTILCGVFGGYL